VTCSGLAVSGKAASGKSTLALLLMKGLSERGYHSRRLSFAEPIYREVEEQFGLRKGDPGWRHAMTSHSRERRAANPNYWIEQAAVEVTRLHTGGLVPIFDDLRLLSELTWLHDSGFATIRVDAPDAVRLERLRDQGFETGVVQASDETEIELDQAEFDVRLDTSTCGGISGLETLAQQLLDQYGFNQQSPQQTV
jgi:dephospho-CoA kinase